MQVSLCGLVLLGRIELPTSSLPMTRSTTELQQHNWPGMPACQTGARYCLHGHQCQAMLALVDLGGQTDRNVKGCL